MTRPRLPAPTLLLVTLLVPELAAQSGDGAGQSNALGASVFRVPPIAVKCGEMRGDTPGIPRQGGDCPRDIPISWFSGIGRRNPSPRR